MNNGEFFYKEYINGNDCAFEEVVKIYYEGLVFFINRYTHSIFDAEDIANDCFLYIAIHKRKYNFKTSLKTYLYMIGRSRALNFIKKHQRKKTDNLDDYINLLNDKEEIENNVLIQERNMALYNVINNLPSEMQNVIYLFYFENMTYEQIALITGKSFKQVDNLLYRAKKILKENLKKEEDII